MLSNVISNKKFDDICQNSKEEKTGLRIDQPDQEEALHLQVVFARRAFS